MNNLYLKMKKKKLEVFCSILFSFFFFGGGVGGVGGFFLVQMCIFQDACISV